MRNLEVREFALLDRDFAMIAKLVMERTGIVLGVHKHDLVYGRLARRLRTLHCPSFADYCRLLAAPDGVGERRTLVNAITTNVTQFFREAHHFEHLSRLVLPGIMGSLNGAPGRIRIWSAGCSSGEEAYSIAMSVRSALGDAEGCDIRILATDIDTDMIVRAKTGRYSGDHVGAIPPALRRRFVRNRSNGTVEMADSLKSLIAFKPLNLLGPWPMHGRCDVIFCRNVAIYFDADTQRVLNERFARLLVPNGWLYVGHSESLLGISTSFDPVGRTIHRRIG